MKNYAMISKNRVIGVLLNQETEPEWGPTPDGSPVTAIPCDDTVTLGMIYDPETGAFSEYTPPEPEPIPEPQPTQGDRIEESVLTIMEAMADQYEERQETTLTQMEVQATIYEELLSMQGKE